MQEMPLHLDFIALVLVLGLFLGFLISFYLIKKSRKANLPNLYMGLFILSITLTMLEGWLNYTGYIFKVLLITNFAEPLNFILAPLLYMFVLAQFGKINLRIHWLHFLPFVFWFGYCMFFFMQPEASKYNSNLEVMRLDIARLKVDRIIPEDPLGIRKYVNILTGASFIIYNILTLKLLFYKARSLGQNLWNTTNKTLIALRSSQYHFLVVIVIFIGVKLFFGNNDVGDYFIYLYITFMLFLTIFQVMNSSKYFNEVSTFLEGPVLKYKKSSLANDDKEIILEAISNQMLQEKYFKSSLASLSGLAKSINESSHHVSQVINEKLNQSFFEMIATYRVEEAKAILKTELGKNLTIEEVAERVGYNSKSAFNTAFKKITSQTPSSYRDS